MAFDEKLMPQSERKALAFLNAIRNVNIVKSC